MKRSSKQNKFNISGLLWNPHPFSIESFGTLPLYMYFFQVLHMYSILLIDL